MFDGTNTFQYLYFIMLCRIHRSLKRFYNKGMEFFFFSLHLYKDDAMIYRVQWFVQGHIVNLINEAQFQVSVWYRKYFLTLLNTFESPRKFV